MEAGHGRLGTEEYCKSSGSTWVDEEPKDSVKVTVRRTESVQEMLQVGV